MSEIKVNSIKGVAASSAAITISNTDGTCTANITNNLSNRNLIINGDQKISQRGTSFAAPADGYTVDRWSIYENLGTGQVAVTQETVTDLIGFTKAAKINTTTAEAGVASASGTQYATYVQQIEAQNLTHIGNGTSSAKTLTFSFYVKSNVTGTFCVSFYKPDNTTRLLSLPYTINSANTWERKTLSLPADTSGGGINDDNGQGLGVYFILARKTGYSGTTSTSWINYTDTGWANTCTASIFENVNDHIFITGCQLEVDNTGSGVATDFEHRSFAQELALCERYCLTLCTGQQYIGTCMLYNSLTHTAAMVWKTTMRAAPTMVANSGTDYYITYRNGGQSTYNSLTGTSLVSANGGAVYTSNGSGTAGHAGAIAGANASTLVLLTAEL